MRPEGCHRLAGGVDRLRPRRRGNVTAVVARKDNGAGEETAQRHRDDQANEVEQARHTDLPFRAVHATCVPLSLRARLIALCSDARSAAGALVNLPP
jgi:hypothetical protein